MMLDRSRTYSRQLLSVVRTTTKNIFGQRKRGAGINEAHTISAGGGRQHN